MRATGPLLVIDTATTRAVIALGRADGTLIERRDWVAGYRHGEELLLRIEALLADAGQDRAGLGGIIVGTGPGAFTGLRVGIATAKGLAHALRLPIVGVPTAAALLAAAATGAGDPGRFALLQPAGPNDRVLSRPGQPGVILPGVAEPGMGHGERLVAVDLDGRAPAEAAALGATAQAGLAAALLAAGAARFASGTPDDLASLVPEYVTLPRGVLAALPERAVEMTGGEARP